jgi:TonB family protein
MSAINAVMPIYPDDAPPSSVTGVVVRIRIETNPEGDVVRLKVKPGTDPVLRKAVVAAVRQWKFKPCYGVDGLAVSVFTRLTFHFIVSKGEPQVDMYDYGPHPPNNLCLGCTNSYREMIEWKEWEEAWSRSEAGVVAPVPLP